MEPLILDKWFALQAQIPERETLERVRGLMNHHGFSLANPNRVRALIGGFTANQTQFNRADGAGFALLEEVVAFLDPTNPQIAARLLTAMRSWRSLEEVRRGHAEAMLRRIAAQPVAVAGRPRHRDPQPGLTPRPSPSRRETASCGARGRVRARSARYASGRFPHRSARRRLLPREKGNGGSERRFHISAPAPFGHIFSA